VFLCIFLRNYPTRENIERRKQEAEECLARGEPLGLKPERRFGRCRGRGGHNFSARGQSWQKNGFRSGRISWESSLPSIFFDFVFHCWWDSQTPSGKEERQNLGNEEYILWTNVKFMNSGIFSFFTVGMPFLDILIYDKVLSELA
jgi:hypothetical protein